MSDLLYSSTITSVRFYLSGDTTAKDDSFIRIKSPDLFRNNTPYPEGLCDAHTGTNAHEYRCQTCLNKKELCLGHEGHIELNYPVWNTLGVNDGRKWIKLICFECYQPIISDDQFKKFSKSKRLDEASKIARAGNKNCVHCGKSHPVIKKDPTEPLVLIASYLNSDKKVERTEKLYSHNVGEIFSKILDETVIKLGKDISSHPRNFIVRIIKVPPITIRTDVKKIGGGRSTNDDLTTALQVIIKKNDSLPAVLPPVIDLKLEKAMIEINNAYYDYIKATGEDSMNSYAKRWKGKYGRFRRNLEGKRVRNMARSTIIGSTHIKIDEVGVPLAFAKIIQYEEVVQEYNKQRLLEYVQNGTKRYPGATTIIKKSTGKSYGVDSLRDIDLESGDIIHRDMIDGDIVNFNRQPSLKVSNIGAHRAIVIRDPTIKTLIMNVMACVLYDADFN